MSNQSILICFSPHCPDQGCWVCKPVNLLVFWGKDCPHWFYFII